MKNYYKKGFTLIELLVVVSIISVLSSVILTASNNARTKGREGLRVSQIHQIQQALALYYSNHQEYPPNSALQSPYLDVYVAVNWREMVMALNADNLIQATFSMNNDNSSKFSLINKAYANLAAPPPITCSIQDPLFSVDEYYNTIKYSYAYVASPDLKSYKIRMYIEDLSSPLFRSSVTGPFLDPLLSTGETACDPNEHYYCISNSL